MFGYFFLIIILLIGCQHREKKTNFDDLNSIKKNFLFSIFEGEIEESPFNMSYSVRTVFFSRDIISLFGVVQVYDHLPHGWWRYEGKTFYRVQGKLKEIKLENLFSTNAQREFLRNYCEEKLKAMANSYFFGQEPLLSKLEFNNINSFAINDKFLIIFFQPYTVGGLEDVPIHVKIPYGHLVDHWNASHLFSQLLRKTIVSKLYTASWDQEDDFQMEITDCLRNTSQMITMKKTSEGGAYVSTQ